LLVGWLAGWLVRQLIVSRGGFAAFDNGQPDHLSADASTNAA
jgi:hypothetical protein